MKEPGIPTSTDKIADDVKCYVNMRIASVKLAMVEGLSKVSGNAVRILVFLLLCVMALIALGTALISWLATVLGSTALAALIVGVALIIVALIVFMVKSLFINPMVGMFSEMFFKPRKHETHDDEDQ
ncbi:MAG: phage holin family protein [Rikenellaceae bacterium]|nr:phage holin family protein [Rikenellaceae bacterium]